MAYINRTNEWSMLSCLYKQDTNNIVLNTEIMVHVYYNR